MWSQDIHTLHPNEGKAQLMPATPWKTCLNIFRWESGFDNKIFQFLPRWYRYSTLPDLWWEGTRKLQGNLYKITFSGFVNESLIWDRSLLVTPCFLWSILKYCMWLSHFFTACFSIFFILVPQRRYRMLWPVTLMNITVVHRELE